MKKHILITGFFIVFLLISSPLLSQESKKIKENETGITKIDNPVIKKLTACIQLLKTGSLESAARLLQEIAGETRLEAKKKYYDTLAQKLLKKELEKIPDLWNSLEDKTGTDLLLYKQGENLIPLLITYKDKENQIFQKHYKNSEKFLEEINFKDKHGTIPSRIAPLYIVDLKNQPDIDSFSLTIPSPGRENQPHYFILFFDNLYERYFKNRIQPVAKVIFKKKTFNKMTLQAGLFFHTMNRISYYFGHVLLPPEKDSADVRTIDQKLLKTFPTIQEIRSNTTSVYLSSIFQEKKVITREEEEAVYFYYLSFLLNKLKYNLNSQSNQAYLIQYNKIAKSDSIQFNIRDIKLDLEIKAFRKLITKLNKEIIKIEKETNAEKFSSLQEAFSDMSTHLQRLLNSLGQTKNAEE